MSVVLTYLLTFFIYLVTYGCYVCFFSLVMGVLIYIVIYVVISFVRSFFMYVCSSLCL